MEGNLPSYMSLRSTDPQSAYGTPKFQQIEPFYPLPSVPPNQKRKTEEYGSEATYDEKLEPTVQATTRKK